MWIPLFRISAFVLIFFASINAFASTFFDVFEYQLRGVQSIDAKDLQEAVAPFTGYARSVEDVDKAAQAIQSVYQKAGFQTVAVSVPDQEIMDGVIVIQVQETQLRRVAVKGSRYFSLSAIKQEMPSLKEGEPLNLRAIQKDAQRINKISTDLQVVPALQPAPQSGKVDVELSVSDKFPFHWGIELTNYHSATTTPTRLAADLRYTNLWQKHHQLGLQYQTTPEDTNEVSVLAGSYLAPVGDSGAKLASYLISSKSDIVTVNDIRVVGDGEIFGTRWVKPILQSRKAMHSVSIGGDYKNFDEVTYTAGLETAVTPIEYLTLTAQYNLFSRGRYHSDSLSLTMVLGSRVVVNDVDEFNNKAFAADSSFSIAKFHWKHNFYLPLGLTVVQTFSGQISEAPLVSNEQFSAGGVSSVRGYYESQLNGDYGIMGGWELQSPDFLTSQDWINELNTYFFIEGAIAYKALPLPQEPGNRKISSYGVGLHSVFFKGLSLKLDAGVAMEPLEGSAEVENQEIVDYVGRIERGDVMVRGSIRYDF